MQLTPNDLHIKDGWTHRWTPIREKGVIQLTGPRLEYRECETRFIVVAAGGRSLKTEIAKRKLVEKFCLNVYFNPNGNVDEYGRVDERYFFAGPTKDQVKEIAWEDIQKMIPKQFIRNINYSKLIIEHIAGPKLYLIGLDVPQRIEGKPWNWGVFTEFADIKEGAWEANLRPLFADRKGGCIIEGRPDMDKPNNSKFEELFERGISGKDPNWESFTWHSKDILDDEELAEAESTMTDLMMDQEFGGKFVKSPGSAYPKFLRTQHVNDEKAVYDPSLNLFVSCDFNVGHHNWGIYQVKDNEWRAIDEVYLQNAQVDDMLLELKEVKLEPLRKIREQFIKRPATLADLNITFYGDYSGDNKSAYATYTGWRQIRNAFEDEKGNSYADFEYRPAPPIGDRLNKVNARLRTADGKYHAYIHSKCVMLIRDLEKTTRKMLQNQTKDGDLTHASDNFGYAICQYER